jgi:flavin-dependent dehydrogenase
VGVVSDKIYVEELAANNGEKFLNHIRTFNDLKGRFSEEELIFEPRTVLNYAVRAKQLFGDGYVLCGNATEFLDPVFSSGVTLATESGLLAAKLIDRQFKGTAVNWQLEYEDHLRSGIDVFREFVLGWYNGDVQTVFFADKIRDDFKRQICSILAGYVWDKTNPFVKKHKTLIHTLAEVLRIAEKNRTVHV